MQVCLSVPIAQCLLPDRQYRYQYSAENCAQGDRAYPSVGCQPRQSLHVALLFSADCSLHSITHGGGGLHEFAEASRPAANSKEIATYYSSL
jgi:hypothetical protein